MLLIVAGLPLAQGGIATAEAVSAGMRITLDPVAAVATGATWTVTGTVVDATGAAADQVQIGLYRHTGASCGDSMVPGPCNTGSAWFTVTDASGRFSYTAQSTLDTVVTAYVEDVDPTTGQPGPDLTSGASVTVVTHNVYRWTSTAATARAWTDSGLRLASPRVATGTQAAVPQTQVSNDRGKTWRTIAVGTDVGAMPRGGVPLPELPPGATLPPGFASAFAPVVPALYASRPGTYQVRIVDQPGAAEAASSSKVATLVVTPRHEPAWLARTNWFRTGVGLPPVDEMPALDSSIRLHVRWMVLNHVVSHVESPGSRGYTKQGNAAGLSSVLAENSRAGTTGRRFVDQWIGAPFHATCLLGENTFGGAGFSMQHGYAGETCQAKLGSMNLVTGQSSPLASIKTPFTFPSSAHEVPSDLLVNCCEGPNPVAYCPSARTGPWSVPVIFHFGAVRPNYGSLHVTLQQQDGHPVQGVCVVDAKTYSGAEPVGSSILGNGHWVFALPRNPLRPGATYTATLSDGSYRQTTTFRIGS